MKLILVALLAGTPVAAAPQDGRITPAVLREAVLDVPAWPADNLQCASGRLQFHDGQVRAETRTTPDGEPPHGDTVLILSSTYGDVDRDGAAETVVTMGCLIEGGSKQIVAYDRDSTGRIVALGRIAATTGEVRDIRDESAKVGDTGVVTARVADYQRCCADRTPQTWQTRGYALRDGKFTQVSGPTRMPLNPRVTDLRLTTGDLTLGAATGGYRQGTVAVTVEHRRGAHPGQLTLTFSPPDGLQRAGTDWPTTTPGPDGSFTVTVAAPAAGGSITHRFTFRRPAGTVGGELPIDLATVPRLSQAVPWTSTAIAGIR
ncbi:MULTISPECIES: hypothetical protein [Actinoplanes]|uniref:hypothetical protein n=1 Tax=Actinoplanes TaxID=1865 RepID=UPI0005F2F62A|nr:MULTISPECIES: hypothetical protein [Actinoplanes]GLY03921.1 hypothetical protein Acsp01_43000 [Actinoplanes sp. NBRC 101535]